jgi:hypothetical protein
MGYYADQPFQNSGQMYGTSRVGPDAFQANPLFGGGSAYYDTANNGQAGYEQFVQGATNGNSNGKFGQWLHNNFYNVNNQYGAAQGKDPTLSFTNYLQNNQNDLQRQYGEQSMGARGEQGQRAVKWL